MKDHPSHSDPDGNREPIQFRLATLLALIAALSVVLGIGRAFGLVGLALLMDALFVTILAAAILKLDPIRGIDVWRKPTLVEWLVVTMVILMLNALALSPVQTSVHPHRRRMPAPITTNAPRPITQSTNERIPPSSVAPRSE
jgi:hypothetical protein